MDDVQCISPVWVSIETKIIASYSIGNRTYLHAHIKRGFV